MPSPQTLRDDDTLTRAPLRVVVHGAAGRMGEGIIAACAQRDDMRVIAAIERADHPRQGQHMVPRAPVISADLTAALAAGADILIDFSAPAAMITAAHAAAAAGVPFLTGTTGLTLDHTAALQLLAAQIPVLAAPNMSLGVNLLHGLVAQASRALGAEWDIEVFELHHRYKRDAPSGTALNLAHSAAAAQANARTLQPVRSGPDAPRRPDEIGLSAARGGDVVGEHTVFFLGDGERIELTHRATDRLIFVNGALRAARWLATASPGFYSMQDVLFSDPAQAPKPDVA
jgi:4-hydroxy-tetrahydrodipicolinate reductase